MKRPLLSALSLLFVILTGIIFFFHYQSAEESIIFFPIAENVHFNETNTHLALEKNSKNNSYIVKWTVSSFLDQNAYLRQDISLLFANGRLNATTSEWKENRAKLTQKKEIPDHDSRHFIAISFHYAELHGNNENVIKSSQQMSRDNLYVIDSIFQPLQSFRLPKTHSQTEWKQILDHTTELQLQYSWNKLIEHFQISKDTYSFIPLTELVKYNDQPLPGLNKQQTQIVIGNLWEGLYKNYFLGIKKEDGSIIKPLGSAIPLIAISHDFTHLFVLIEAGDGTAIKLIQHLELAD